MLPKDPAVCPRRNICLHGCWTSLLPESPGLLKAVSGMREDKLMQFFILTKDKMEAL